MTNLLQQAFNGLVSGSFYALLALGLAVIFGMLRVVNFAHGAFYMLGAYLAISVADASGSFVLAGVAAAAAVMVLAVALHEGLLKRLEMEPLRQVLLTFGVTLIVAETARHVWGGYPKILDTPSLLEGRVDIGVATIPTYRVFVIGVAIVLGVALGVTLARTRIGAVVRACIDDREIASSIGIDVERVFTLVFAFSGLLAGLAGAIGAPFLGAYQGVEFEVLALTLVVVVFGGLGSVLGAFLGSMVIGVINSVGTAAAPELSYFLLFGPMILILTLRPTGLLGREQ
jgi:branched-chain amino acid transport system permease protein